ncbi:diacylglycerol/lipid kinase family protein [candidate division KSB1 bacterium]
MKTLLIINPKSGKGAAKKIVPKLEKFFEKNYIDLDVYFTKKEMDGSRKAKAVCKSKKYDVIIASGGDGTMNEVLNGIAGSGMKKKPLFGMIPLGTENVLAQEMKIPFNHLKAAKVIVEGILTEKTKKIDLGNANGRFFVLMTGIGFDAHVASKLEPFLKKILGRAVYPLTAWNELFKYKHSDMDIVVDKKIKTRGSYVVVGNTKFYGAGMKITPNADISDGFLDVCIFKGNDVFKFIKFVAGVFAEKHIDTADIEYHKAKEVSIKSKDKVLCHVDCEVMGTTPVKVKVYPGIVEMIVP